MLQYIDNGTHLVFHIQDNTQTIYYSTYTELHYTVVPKPYIVEQQLQGSDQVCVYLYLFRFTFHLVQFTIYFYIFNYWVDPPSNMVEDQPAVYSTVL